MKRLILLVVLGAVVVSASVPAGAQDRGQRADRRVLIVAVPGLTWDEVEDESLPVLDGLLADSAVAALAPHSVRRRSRPGDAYLTMGGGTRSIGDPDVDGTVLNAGADFFGEPAGGVYERRTGRPADEGIVTLSWPALVRANDREPFDVVLGLLASTLHRHGVATAAIGNADGSDLTRVSFERQVALALADRDGHVSQGTVGPELLDEDPAEPFGVRLDIDATVDAFDSVWPDESRTAVIVEASDLARSLRYRPFVDAARYAELRTAALERTDRLLGELLERVDPTRDAVFVVGGYHRAGRTSLVVAALRAPEVPVGYLESATTQRAGIVSLVDVAPSVLATFGIERPTDMEGRPFEVERSSSSLDHRIERLVRINAASRFREHLLTPTTIAVVLVLGFVVAAMVLAVAGGWSPRWRRAIALAALADLAALPMSYVARAFPLEDLGDAFYWSFLIPTSILVAVGAMLVGDRVRRPIVPLTIVLALGAGVLVSDVMTGSNLHLSSAFGYSPTGNSRLYGISNYSFGQLSVASLLLAALVAHRWPSRAGRAVALAMLVFTLVVLGIPIWGSDVGGIIAFTPTLLVFAAILFRRRATVRSLVIAGLATSAAVVAFGFADLARPAGERAHLGRLFERIGDEGIQPLLSIMERKLLANFRVSTSSFWVAAIPIAIACWLFLRWWRTRPLDRVHAALPTLHAALVAGAVAALLGSIVNDSGAIVGGVACLVMTTTLVYVTVTDSR